MIQKMRSMNLYLKFEVNTLFQKVLETELKGLPVAYTVPGPGELRFHELVPDEVLNSIRARLDPYGIKILENPRAVLIQKIKDAIIELVYREDSLARCKLSVYLSERLRFAYGYLSKLFSEATYTSIENYLILQKTERAKQLIASEALTFTEIAWKLNYSSVAHFSTQFKNTTGLTPTSFQRIINKKKAVSVPGLKDVCLSQNPIQPSI